MTMRTDSALTSAPVGRKAAKPPAQEVPAAVKLAQQMHAQPTHHTIIPSEQFFPKAR